ncbi:NAD+ synthase, partial [Candidatus Omnitrophota bacterium]
VSDLVIFPELSITGYPPRDLLENPSFIKKTEQAVEALLKMSGKYPNAGMIVGTPTSTGKKTGKGLYNSAILIYGGKIWGMAHKSLLPSYDVFDETRYFDPSPRVQAIQFKDYMLGVSVCEDMWNDPELWPKEVYTTDPMEKLEGEGATVLINISASPFYAGKEKIRYDLMRSHAVKHGVPLVFVNQVGGNDELIFDGRSMCLDASGDPIEVLPIFEEHVEMVDTDSQGKPGLFVPQEEIRSVHSALVLGLKDYMRKCDFSKVVVGLSGGVDSALVCCLAAEAIGKENVLGVAMPSPYSSEESLKYSEKLAKKIGIDLKTVPISDVYESYIKTLKKDLSIKEDDVSVAMQNIQARIRGNILMAFSNEFEYLLLTTGNKSELAVGYCTLYGDMAGGLAVISDVPKTMVYRLAEFVNKKDEIIPKEIIKRPPSAELKPEQVDQDTLPPYESLDKVLYSYMVEGSSEERMLKIGFDPELIKWVIRSVNRNEYKRRQAPPGLKVTSKAFGMGRRMPIAAKHDF